jgi:hypothetical protein
MEGSAGTMEEDIWILPTLAGKNGNASVQPVTSRQNQSAKYNGQVREAIA